VNFFYIIGPTLFHIFLPIPKSNNYDIFENSPILKPNKSSHGIEILNFIMNQDRKLGEEIYEDENNKMDPYNFLEKAKQIYKDYTII